MTEIEYAEYGSVANEYYDVRRHPTCANFRALSKLYVKDEMNSLEPHGTIVEVGCGKAIVPNFLPACKLKNVVLLDSSSEMIRHSSHWEELGVKLHVGDARILDELTSSASLVVASLADPYNDELFWEAVHRSLAYEGVMIATLPSFHWASSFRTLSKSPHDGALFELSNGTFRLMRSLILPLHEQVQLIERSGLTVQRFEGYGIDKLETASLSPKLTTSGRHPVLWGITARKLDSSN